MAPGSQQRPLAHINTLLHRCRAQGEGCCKSLVVGKAAGAAQCHARYTYRKIKSPVRIHTSRLISRTFPDATFTTVYEINPRLSPVAILNVRGVAIMVMNAGTASLKSLHSMCAIDCVISAPTTMSAGAVAYPGMAAASGEQNMAARKKIATNTLLSPVRAPAATPATLSM